MPYLALRYYLANMAARGPRWAVDVAAPLVLQRSAQPYFTALHFKERTQAGEVVHRPMHLPSANEALAEAVLLDECGRSPAFKNPASVFSYELATGDATEGVFVHYFKGLRTRHEAIAGACKADPAAIVQYSDIRRFYPSTKPELASSAWHRHAELGHLPRKMTELGTKLIAEHDAVRPDGAPQVLTGPMLSHLLGNLVLRSIDEAMATGGRARYFRYVDDIVLVGSPDKVKTTYRELTARLDDLGLTLHPEDSEKHIVVSGPEWLKGERDFHDSTRSISWKTLVGGIKQYLTAWPDQAATLRAALRDGGARLPILDYQNAVHERAFLTRISNLSKLPWFRGRVQARSIELLLNQVAYLREAYHREAQTLIDLLTPLKGYERKRQIPKLRYRVGRLAYLAHPHALVALSEQLRGVPELLFHACVLHAVATGEVDELLTLGTNAVQAAAQALRAAGQTARVSNPIETAVQKQGFAILALNGVDVAGATGGALNDDELIRIARLGPSLESMNSKDPFLRELACLHGVADRPRHPEFLETAFDEDEELALDVMNDLRASGAS